MSPKAEDEAVAAEIMRLRDERDAERAERLRLAGERDEARSDFMRLRAALLEGGKSDAAVRKRCLAILQTSGIAQDDFVQNRHAELDPNRDEADAR